MFWSYVKIKRKQLNETISLLIICQLLSERQYRVNILGVEAMRQE